jgi:hypothetical protein
MTTTELEPYDLLVGSWDLDLTHPALEGAIRGQAHLEWLGGGAFLIQRATADHPAMPDGLWVIGAGPDGLQVDYFDSRGVRRVYATSLHGRELRFWRAVPGFSQRFLGTISEDGRTIDGLWEVSTDDATWADDLRMRFVRR